MLFARLRRKVMGLAAVVFIDGRYVGVVNVFGAISRRGEWEDFVELRDLISGGLAGGPLIGHTKRVSCAAVVTVGGKPVLATGALDNTIRFWDRDGSQLDLVQLWNSVSQLVAASDGTLLARVGGDMVALRHGTKL
jgi:WD40 repeat protein